MSEDEDPAVMLGSAEPVEGAPLARVSARLMWGIERETVIEREGETEIRTPEGPRTLGDILEAVEEPYFGTRREFEQAVRRVIGRGPVPTGESTSESEHDADDDAGEKEHTDDADTDEAADTGDTTDEPGDPDESDS